MILKQTDTMTEILHEFKQGPYDVLEFTVKTDDGKALIEINEGDLGRLPIENVETVEELREALEKVEMHLKEMERRKEEL
jgi:bifunctional DNA-binding transcriptional regulator/antitoxin component of YhaV-PrlF toxin-antitoxin module